MLLMKDFAGDRRGVTMIEYALIAALVAMVCFSILVTMGSSLSGLYSRIESRISSVSLEPSRATIFSTDFTARRP